MAIEIDPQITPRKLLPKIECLFEVSAQKLDSIQRAWKPSKGTPVFTIQGRYTSRGWTEWTQGFQFGSAILQFDVTGEERFLKIGRAAAVRQMAAHVSHTGVHDHGFNNVSTYGNLLRLMREGRLADNEFERAFYELALKVSGAVQAGRWTQIANGEGYIYSFNGPHSLFIDTIRSLRVLAIAHRLGHVLMGEGDRPISLLRRLIEHARSTSTYNVYYGNGQDAYDTRGRTAHESLFNLNDGNYRCPNSQQGYSPFSTWTRGLAWAICGFAEQLEFLTILGDSELNPLGGRESIETMMRKAAEVTADFYLENSCRDGIPIWDTGAPGAARMGDYLSKRSDPYNQWEPMDSSAAAIAAQGLIRLGNYLNQSEENISTRGKHYQQAGLTTADTLFSEPYLSTDVNHQGLILHSVYHRPNGWDYLPPGRKVPCGESSMWGDYHARELALMICRQAKGMNPYHFYDCVEKAIQI